MADVYLETIRPKVLEYWKKLGKEPMHLVKKRLTKTAGLSGIKEARAKRASYIKKNPQKIVSINEELSELKKQIDEKKRSGVDTSRVEIDLQVLEDRVKPFKGKIPAGDADVLRLEAQRIEGELSELEKKEVSKEKKE